MPYFETSQEWFEQSSLLLQARPITTRTIAKYKVLPPTTTSNPKKRKADRASAEPTDPSSTSTSTTTPAAPAGPKATLTLKTFDPVSGACLKYRTDKAAEVGRLVGSLGRLGRRMAALPDEAAGTGAEDATMGDGVQETAAAEAPAAAPQQQQQRQTHDGKAEGGTGGAAGGGGGGGGAAKKKKKGKK